MNSGPGPGESSAYDDAMAAIERACLETDEAARRALIDEALRRFRRAMQEEFEQRARDAEAARQEADDADAPVADRTGR